MHISQFSCLTLDFLFVFEELVKTQIGFDLGIPVDIVRELLTLQFTHVLSHVNMFSTLVLLTHFLKH